MTDPAYVTRDEFERRTRVLEGEVEGEKVVTRHILEQTRRNNDDLLALGAELRSELGILKARADHAAGDMATVKAMLGTHTTLLKVLTQDVGLLRTQLTAQAQDMSQIRTQLTALTQEVSQIHSSLNVLVQEVRAALAPRDQATGQ
jgi:chromosome segregation ATPase